VEQVNKSIKELQITNEFAQVIIRQIPIRNGSLLEIFSPKTGTVIRLDALSLESLTWQDEELFTKFLGNPQAPSEF